MTPPPPRKGCLVRCGVGTCADAARQLPAYSSLPKRWTLSADTLVGADCIPSDVRCASTRKLRAKLANRLLYHRQKNELSGTAVCAPSCAHQSRYGTAPIAGTAGWWLLFFKALIRCTPVDSYAIPCLLCVAFKRWSRTYQRHTVPCPVFVLLTAAGPPSRQDHNASARRKSFTQGVDLPGKSRVRFPMKVGCP